MGCEFCGSGQSFVCSLSAVEMAEQVRHMLMDRGLAEGAFRSYEVRFSAMGEPLLNFHAVDACVRWLHAHLRELEFLICTTAPRANHEALLDLGADIPTLQLQFSVHASLDEERNAMIPFKAKLSLQELAELGRQWLVATGRKPYFNYCAMPANSSRTDACRLGEIFDPELWRANISALCEVRPQCADGLGEAHQLACRFAARMAKVGFESRVESNEARNRVGGGNGQLWQVQGWMAVNADRVLASAGRRQLRTDQAARRDQCTTP